MSVTRSVLSQYLAEQLCVQDYKDYCPNGLQVEGREVIQDLALAVTASAACIEKAANVGADALLVHHGIFWKGAEPVLTGVLSRRVKKLMAHDMNLFAYHLPLDCHAQWGNNAQLARVCGFDVAGSVMAGGYANLLWHGSLSESCSPAQLATHLQSRLQRAPWVIEGGDHAIKRIAWCTGAAQDFIEEAAHLGVEAFISGEISERTTHLARELGIHYFSAGHHATERFGVIALGEALEKRFKVTLHLIEDDNPV